VIIALVLAGIGHGQSAVSKVALPASTTVNSGKSDDANTAVDKLIAAYVNNAHLASNLVDTAGQYVWDRKYDGANRLYQAIIDKDPNNPLAAKARLGLARLNVLTLIEEKNYPLAQQQADSMAVDFNSEPDLPVALFHIGKEFTWQHRDSEAKDVLAHIAVQTLPDSFSKEVQLWSARANVCSLISKATDTEVVAATDKLMSDFAGDSGLAEAVYWISKEYEWKKGTTTDRTSWYDTPNSVYQKLMQQFSDTPYGQDAQWDQKRLAYRMKIFKLISEPNQAATDAAVETMITDLKGRPELAGELYWIACGYEEQPDKGPQAEQMYARIVKDCPGTDEASRAALDVRRRVFGDVLDSGDVNSAYALLDNFIAGFKQNLYLGDCLGRITIGCYKKASELRDQNQPDKAMLYHRVCADVWERIQKNNLSITSDLVYLYFYSAANYDEMGRWLDAINNYQKILDNWPEFESICGVQAAIGGCYEGLRDRGSMPKEAANPLIKQAFKAVLANWPDCYSAAYVSMRLGDMAMEEGDKVTAKQYYQLFLAKVKSKDKQIEAVKAKLAALSAEGGNNQ
jgi:tetratricopeptide (TPR) repeat protein